MDYANIMQNKYRLHSGKILVCAITLTTIFTGCGSKHETPASIDSTMILSEEDYHADNDIAMTLSSIADAIRVKEPLDSVEYNYVGILTDGEGHPIYTNLQGMPGSWDIEVLNDESVVIRNVEIGDLLSDDLESYITAALGLSEQDLIYSEHDEDEPYTDIAVYDFDGGFLRIETRMSTASNGLEGPLMRIMATRTAPTL